MKHSRKEEFTPGDAFKFGGKSRRAAAETETELSIAKARGKARAEGFEEGVRQTEARIDREVQDTLAAVAAAVELARADRAAAERDMVAVSRRLVVAFLRRIAPAFAQAALVEEIEEMVQNALKGSAGGDLRIRVAPGRSDEIEARLKSHDLSITIEADPSIEPTRAEAVWAGGFDDIDIGALAERAIAILDAALVAAAPQNTSAEELEIS